MNNENDIAKHAEKKKLVEGRNISFVVATGVIVVSFVFFLLCAAMHRASEGAIVVW